jgi:hypothetical protein
MWIFTLDKRREWLSNQWQIRFFSSFRARRKWKLKCNGKDLRSHFVTNRSPRLFPHLVVRNLGSRTPDTSPTPTSETSSEQFFRPRVEYDPDFDDTLTHPFNSWTILGIAIVITTSGAFWTGVALLINHLLK